jgi:hypothetical protein
MTSLRLPLHPFRGWFPLHVGALAIALTCTVAAPTHAQNEPQFSTWTKAESSEDAKKYFDQIKKGEFDAGSKAFLERVALPQLAAEGNRRQIERVRRRMRDTLLNDKTAEAAALSQAAKTAVEWLAAQARNPQAEAVVRVNAMLLVGEVRGKDGRPWSGAVEPLAAAMSDSKLPAGVRVAAAAGLARHVDAAKAAGAPDPALAQAALKPLLEVIATPVSPTDAAAGEWLVARALDMLPTVEAKAAPETAAALTAILREAGHPVDVRVRAAAALGATATPDSKIDVGDAIAKIRSLAAEALKADLAAATERSLTARLSGQPLAAPMQPGLEGMQGPVFPGGVGEFGAAPGTMPPDDPMESLVIRRDAWRLWKLATAVATPDGAAGLAALLDEAAATRAKTVATTLRESATALDESPETATVKEALVAIERLAQAAPPASPRAPNPAAAPAGPAAQPANDPFGAGN